MPHRAFWRVILQQERFVMKKLYDKILQTKHLGTAMLAGAAGTAQAGGTSLTTGNGGEAISQSGFDDFESTILFWVNGPLGVGLAVTSLVVGGAIGIAQSNPMPAIGGIVLAGIFAFAPGVIASLVSGGAMIAGLAAGVPLA